MPRHPRTNHPLRQLRKAGGLTQEEVAEALGVTAQTVKRIENGQGLKLTVDQAHRLAAKYGVLPMSLMTGQEKPLDLFGREYSATSFADWNAAQVNEGVTDDLIRKIGLHGSDWLGALLRAAREKGAFMEVKLDFDAWLLTEIKKLGLENTFNPNLRELTHTFSEQTHTVAEALANPQLMRELNFPADTRWTGALPVRVRRECYPVYSIIPVNVPLNSHGANLAPLAVTVTGRRMRTVCTVKVSNKQWVYAFDKLDSDLFVANNGSATPPSGQPSVPPAPAPPVESPKTSKPRRASRARGSA